MSDYYTKVCGDLEKLATLTQRLDYWKDKVYSRVGSDFNKIKELFSTNINQVSPLRIPVKIWDDYFEPLCWENIEIGGQANRIHSNEYNDWMTEFNAREYAEYLINELNENLEKSNDPIFLIEIELNRLIQFESDVKEIVIQPNSSVSDLKNEKEKYEYYRFLYGEYKGEEHSHDDLLIKTIAKHKYLKPYLQNLRQKGSINKTISQNFKGRSRNHSNQKRVFSEEEIVYSFKWIGNNPKSQISKLYSLLIKDGYIPENTDSILFHNAFQDKEIKAPYNIRWVKKVKGKLSKPLLFYFISVLEVKKLIESIKENNTLYKKTENIFADPSGNKLKNLAESKRYSNTGRKKDKTPQEKRIDEIIKQVFD